jgi:hypothetical protein
MAKEAGRWIPQKSKDLSMYSLEFKDTELVPEVGGERIWEP